MSQSTTLTRRRSKKLWLILAGAGTLAILGVLAFVAASLASRYQPLIHDLAVEYLEQRFQARVELGDFRVDLPKLSPVRLWLTRGKGTIAHVQGTSLVLHRLDASNAPPLLTAKSFSFDLDLGSVIAPPAVVPHMFVDGLEINVPPREATAAPQNASALPGVGAKRPRFTLEQVAGTRIDDLDIVHGRLTILPRDPTRAPLEFTIHELRLQPTRTGNAMAYGVSLDNPKPPGIVKSQGTFGPWNAANPADSPVRGNYIFENADLGVFNAIAGKVSSTGNFSGTLGAIAVEGAAEVPDFRLKRSGNPVPLHTEFSAIVDGENGNTTLHPIHARLGKTQFVTSGTVMKREKDVRRSIEFDVDMAHGDIRDLLLLSMRGEPFLTGEIALKAHIVVPPLTGQVREKLRFSGHFDIESGQFLRVKVQKVLDELSRRGQGRPSDHSIEDVFSSMQGVFHLEDQNLNFESLAFAVPGAGVKMHGSLALDQDEMDFHGAIAMDARLSEMLTGWKRWLAKPIDPFFEKNGAGTYLRIKIGGSTKNPTFGLDH